MTGQTLTEETCENKCSEAAEIVKTEQKSFYDNNYYDRA